MFVFLKRWVKNDNGQAVAEAALMLPFLIFILIGIFVVGYWLYVRQVVVAAAREGARVGAQTGDYASLDEAARSVMMSVDADLNKDRISVTTQRDQNGQRGTTLIVQVSYDLLFGSNYFRVKYEEPDTSGKLHVYPFEKVVEQSAARMETDYTSER